MDQTVKFTPLDMQTWPRAQMFYYFSKNGSDRIFPDRRSRHYSDENSS